MCSRKILTFKNISDFSKNVSILLEHARDVELHSRYDICQQWSFLVRIDWEYDVKGYLAVVIDISRMFGNSQL